MQADANFALILAQLTRAREGDIALETSEICNLARDAMFLCQRAVSAFNEISGNK